MHTIAARRLTVRARLAAGGLLAGAAALAVVPVGAAGDEGHAGDQPGGLAPMARAKPVDPIPPATEVSLALNKVAPPVPKTEPPKDKDKPGGAGGDKPAAPPPPPPWRYIGSITNASYRRAIMVINDSQKLLAEGDKVDDSTLIEINSDYLVLRDGTGAERQVMLAPKQIVTLQLVGAAPPAKGGQPVGRTPAEEEDMKLKAESLRRQEQLEKMGGKPRPSLKNGVQGVDRAGSHGDSDKDDK